MAVSGCGGGGHTASRSSGAGLAAAPAARILAAAEAAIDHVHSFHLQVTAAIPGTTVSESTYLLLPGEATLAEQNGSDMLDLRAVSGMIYFRGNRTYYASTGVRGAELATLPGRWVSATPSQVPEPCDTRVEPFTTHVFDVPPVRTNLTAPVPLPPLIDIERPAPTVPFAETRVRDAWLRRRNVTVLVVCALK